jgi:hypothetical protein
MVGVAQLVEPRIVDPVVVGSNPIVHPKKATLDFQLCSLPPSAYLLGPLAQLVEQLTLNQLVVGSSPTRPTIFPQAVELSPFLEIGRLKQRCGPIPVRATCCPVYSISTDRWPPRPGCCGVNPCLVAKVAELVDALDLGSSGATRESSSLSFRTIHAADRGNYLV